MMETPSKRQDARGSGRAVDGQWTGSGQAVDSGSRQAPLEPQSSCRACTGAGPTLPLVILGGSVILGRSDGEPLLRASTYRGALWHTMVSTRTPAAAGQTAVLPLMLPLPLMLLLPLPLMLLLLKTAMPHVAPRLRLRIALLYPGQTLSSR